MDIKEAENALVPKTESLPDINKETLNQESLDIINQIIAETDRSKTKDLTELFNNNQTKKTMIRVNRLGELLDTITDQTIARYKTKPDEISNQELLQGLKIVQDIVERGQKQIADNAADKPLIQINQQNNEVNLGDAGNLTKESRDKVKNAVMSILANIQNTQVSSVVNSNIVESDIIDVQGGEVNDE